MARFVADYAFDIRTFDFNWYSRNYFNEDLDRGVNDRINGVVYRDFRVVNGFNSGPSFWDDYYLVAGGSGFGGSARAGTAVGTVTFLAETWANQSGFHTALWGMTGFSVTARSIVQAGQTSGLSDDLAVFATALRGNDRIELSNFDDRMMGFAGSDTIFGNGGSDVIEGGKGKDHLYGGTGSDVFIFDDGDSGRGAGGSGRDIIYDFNTVFDTIDLRLVDANTSMGGDQNFIFSATSGARNAVWLGVSGANTIVFGDNTGDGRADFEIQLNNASFVTASDFIL